jgi:hypothetical protein
MRRHASPPAGNLDALVNKYRAAFRNADQPLAQAQAQFKLIANAIRRWPPLCQRGRQTTVYDRVRNKEQA